MTKIQNAKQGGFAERVEGSARRASFPVFNILTLLFRICFGIRVSIFGFTALRQGHQL
jgi:hypothetical protein